jgi:dTDP-4-dehydrorhamnose reductase
MQSKVLITGSTGLLGCSLTSQLRTGAFPRWDLTQGPDTQRALDAIQPDVIVNCVALTDVDKCETDPALAKALNVTTVENLARWVSKHSKTKLIQISTDQVYDSAGESAEHEVKLSNQYACTKFAAELVASAVNGTVLRTNFFGHSQCAGRKSLSDWLIESFQQRRTIQLYDDIMFNPLSLPSLCEQIARVIEMPSPGVFNLGSHGGMSKAEFGFAVGEAMGLQTATASRSTSASAQWKTYRPKDMRMNVALFEQIFSVKLPSLAEEIMKLRSATRG